MAAMEQVQNVSLQQTLSPQMRQSLAILQAPVAELRQMVQQEMQTNPVLEEGVPMAVDEEEEEESPEEGQEEAESSMQDEWRDWMVQPAAEGRNFAAEERRRHFMESLTESASLQEYLLQQLSTSDLNASQRKIAEAIIGNLNDEGFLSVPPADIAFQLHASLDAVEPVLDEIQAFDPAGVAARDLRECLLIQLRREGKEDSLEYRIVANHLDQLGRKKYPDIARKLRVEVQDVQEAAEAIGRLNPRPARNYSSQPDQIVHADLAVERDGKAWQVMPDEQEIPSLRISNTYKDLLSAPGDSAELRAYLRDKIREGKFFMRCIQQRQETLLRIGRIIAEKQQDFLEHGPSHLRPMTMAEVARIVEVHETTVSRAVAGKYISTPHGLFELRYFFTSGYSTGEGKTISNKGVQEVIAELIGNENARQPLSDQDIAGVLSGRGIPVARRTIAKYREQLGILPSHLRRKF